MHVVRGIIVVRFIEIRDSVEVDLSCFSNEPFISQQTFREFSPIPAVFRFNAHRCSFIRCTGAARGAEGRFAPGAPIPILGGRHVYIVLRNNRTSLRKVRKNEGQGAHIREFDFSPRAP